MARHAIAPVGFEYSCQIARHVRARPSHPWRNLACRCLLGCRRCWPGTNDLARSRSGLALTYTRKTPRTLPLRSRVPCARSLCESRLVIHRSCAMGDVMLTSAFCGVLWFLAISQSWPTRTSLATSLARSLNAADYNSGTTAAGGGGDMYVEQAHAIHVAVPYIQPSFESQPRP